MIALILWDSLRAGSLCVSLCRWKASTFSVNGLERCELNIDFIGSLVAVAALIHPLAGADGMCCRNERGEEMSKGDGMESSACYKKYN